MRRTIITRTVTLALLPLALCVLCVLFICGLSATAQETQAQSLKKSFISFRIGVHIWNNDARFAQLLTLFDKYPGVTDEITFFTQTTHSPITDDELVRRCKILESRMAECRKHGYRSGINILCTMGHHQEDLPHMIGPEFPRAITLEGVTTQGTLCMNQEIFRERIRRIYRTMAEAKPDYIWIDDDVRVGHSGGQICYCPLCMKLISDELGQPHSREDLAAKMNQAETRALVHKFTSDSINRLFGLIESVVHQVNPSLPLGFMTGERYAEGYDFHRWSQTLAGPGGASVYWRPGGGFYSHENIYQLTGKSHEIGRQVSLLPTTVECIESEIENFPYHPLEKARRVTALEAACHIAAGCTGAAFNVLTMDEMPLDDYEPMIAELAKWRPFFDLEVQAFGRRPNVGVQPLWTRTDADNPVGNPIAWQMGAVAEAGIPMAYRPESIGTDEKSNHENSSSEDSSSENSNRVVMFSRGFLNLKPREQVREYFKGGVYTDNDALGLINQPGKLALNNLSGMEYGGQINVDGIEKYTDHALNGKFAGYTRDNRQSFWGDTMIILKKTCPGVETLSQSIDYSGAQTAETIVGIYENPLGGRVCINGYHPWSHFHSRPKQTQLRNIFRWLSRDTLPAYVESFDRAFLWVRQADAQGRLAALAFNANYDPCDTLTVCVLTTEKTMTVWNSSSQPTTVQSTGSDGPYQRFVLPPVGPWDVVLMRTCE